MVNSHRSIIIVSLVFILCTSIVTCQAPGKSKAQNSCASKTTCRECIQTQSCAWCMQPDFDENPRCIEPSQSGSAGSCLEEYTWNPDNEQRLLINRELTRAGSSTGGGHWSGSYSESNSSSSSSSSSHSFAESNGGSGAWGASGQQSIVQISPQRVGLKLRISE